MNIPNIVIHACSDDYFDEESFYRYDTIFKWNFVFIVAGSMTLGVSVIAFVSLIILEAKGMLAFKSNKRSLISGFTGIFKIENLIFYVVKAPKINLLSLFCYGVKIFLLSY